MRSTIFPFGVSLGAWASRPAAKASVPATARSSGIDRRRNERGFKLRFIGWTSRQISLAASIRTSELFLAVCFRVLVEKVEHLGNVRRHDSAVRAVRNFKILVGHSQFFHLVGPVPCAPDQIVGVPLDD